MWLTETNGTATNDKKIEKIPEDDIVASYQRLPMSLHRESLKFSTWFDQELAKVQQLVQQTIPTTFSFGKAIVENPFDAELRRIIASHTADTPSTITGFGNVRFSTL